MEPYYIAGLSRRWFTDDRCAACYQAAHQKEEYDRKLDQVVRELKSEDEAARRRIEDGIPPLYRGAMFANYECPTGDARALERVRAWDPTGVRGFYLVGGPGSGKTRLALTLVRERRQTTVPIRERYPQLPDRMLDAIEDRFRGAKLLVHTWYAVVNFPEMLEETRRAVRDSVGSNERRGPDPAEALCNAGVAVLDDVDAEGKATPLAAKEVYRILNTRLVNQRPTIITSNRNLDELADYYGATAGKMAGQRIASRIAEACEIITVNAPDYRIERAAKEAAARKARREGKAR